jgi:hypothetical protein
MALTNDELFFYLRLTTHDDQLHQQFGSGGFTLWIDPQGGAEKNIEVRISSSQSGRPAGPPQGGQMNERGQRGLMSQQTDADAMSALDDVEPMAGNVETRQGPPERKGRPGEEVKLSFELAVNGEERGGYFADNNRFGLIAAQGQQQSGLIYELKVPLTGELYLGLVEPGAVLTIGLEGSTGQGPAGQGQGSQGSSGAPSGQQGGGGGGGMKGGGQSGGQGKPGGRQSEPLDVSFRVKLAIEPQ